MTNKLYSFVVSVIVLTVATVTNPVNAYTFFTDREAWLSAVSGLPLLEENFDGIPDGTYPAGTFPSDVFTNLELFPSNPLPMAITDGKVVPVINRDFSVYMSFPQPVLAVGLDVINPNNLGFEYQISEGEFSNPGAFSFFGTFVGNIDFLGWVADDGENAVTETFVFFHFSPRLGFTTVNIRSVSPIPTHIIDIRAFIERNIINPRSRCDLWVAFLSDTVSVSPFDPT